MDAFSYLSVLFSVILGLALTQLLKGMRSVMLARSRVRLYWPALIWVGVIALVVTQDWWSMFGMRGIKDWTFAMYAIVLLMVTLLYLVAGLAVPDIERHGEMDLRESYFAHARWFFGLFAFALVVSVFKDLIINGQFPSRINLAFHGLFFVGATIAAVTKSRWYHALLAPIAGAVFVGYIVLLFARL
ncbi:MAG: hypothetical protein WCA81_19005 [Rhizomicrobium sp.]